MVPRALLVVSVDACYIKSLNVRVHSSQIRTLLILLSLIHQIAIVTNIQKTIILHYFCAILLSKLKNYFNVFEIISYQVEIIFIIMIIFILNISYLMLNEWVSFNCLTFIGSGAIWHAGRLKPLINNLKSKTTNTFVSFVSKI